MNQYQGHGNLFESYNIKQPKQDEKKHVTIEIEIKPYVAAKNFILNIMSDKK